jgi:hypothetical protein
VDPDHPAHHQRLEKVAFQLVLHDEDGHQHQRSDPALGAERDGDRQRARDQDADQRHERGQEDQDDERRQQRHAHHPQGDADDHGVDGRHRDGAPHVVGERLPRRRAGSPGTLPALGAQEAGQPGPDPVTVLEQEEGDEQHEDQPGQDLQEDPSPAQHRAGHRRLMLLEKGQYPVGQLLQARLPEVERRPRQPSLQVMKRVPEFPGEGLVVGRRLGGRQRGRPGEHRDRHQQRAPGRRERRQAGLAQAVGQWLQQRREQECGDER